MVGVGDCCPELDDAVIDGGRDIIELKLTGFGG
jgi:hypothetical protein